MGRNYSFSFLLFFELGGPGLLLLVRWLCEEISGVCEEISGEEPSAGLSHERVLSKAGGMIIRPWSFLDILTQLSEINGERVFQAKYHFPPVLR